MRKLNANEYNEVYSLDEALKVNGFYAMVDNDMRVQAMCIYMVKDGKIYDDISLDCGIGSLTNEDFEECEDYHFAKLTTDYSEVFRPYGLI